MMLSYLLMFWPYADNIQNYLELFNEILIMEMVINHYLFTDFVDDPQLRNQIGWV